MAERTIVTRREFLRASAAAAALAAGGGLAACTSDPPGGGRGPGTTGPAADLARIASVAIHPAIGIARVGNSEDSFWFGPEVPGGLPRPRGGFKDAAGAIARQAARFRIYGLDERGAVVRELSATDARITWSVTVANKKAAWYDFDVALDLPVAKPVARRNPDVTDAARDQLVVAPPTRSITGAAAGPVALDGGTFQAMPVPLGELMTDERGRLVFLPARGLGYSPSAAPLTTYSDNNGWADDICDGPVLATVEIAGRVLHAEPAWVIVTPPNYGPGLSSGLVSAEDSARLAWAPAEQPTGAKVSFVDDVLPIFARIVDMQWVNAGFLTSNGWGSDADYLDGALLSRLADPSTANAAFRRDIAGGFRDPSYATAEPDAIPQIYGDGVTIPAETPYQWLTVTRLQHDALTRWAAGDFVDDRDSLPRPTELDELPLQDQPRALDRAGLASCLGGAYHPGIEVPWALRVPSIWAAPYRLRMADADVRTADYGPELSPAVAMSADGPLAGSGPGDLTRWQGVPWQSDAASCRSGYERELSPVLPTFWPARVPNHVLREADYRIVVDASRPLAERQAAFERRYDWERFVAGPDRETTLNNMMKSWFDLGLVTEQPGPTDGAFPRTMKVESLVGFTDEPAVTYGPRFVPESPEAYNGQAPPR